MRAYATTAMRAAAECKPPARSNCTCRRTAVGPSLPRVLPPDHALEREAERIATNALRGSLAVSAGASAHSGAGPIARACGASEAQADDAGTLVASVLESPGQPLAAPIRARAEQRFGNDFSRVRVHADERAARSADALHAAAYTRGHAIVFARGHYRPDTPGGERLLAHELAHTLQHPPSIARQPRPGPDTALPERRPRAPELRPAIGETVRGFPVGLHYCGCRDDIARRRAQIGRLIVALEACRRGPQSDVDGLYRCVRLRAYGRDDVPAGAETLPGAGRVRWPTVEQRQRRAELLGQSPACERLTYWAVLVHESAHIEQFNAMAADLGAAFNAEFRRLEGRADRIEQLRRQFPRETAQYMARIALRNTTRGSAAQMETGALQAEDAFYRDADAVLNRICPATTSPQPGVSHPPVR